MRLPSPVATGCPVVLKRCDAHKRERIMQLEMFDFNTLMPKEMLCVVLKYQKHNFTKSEGKFRMFCIIIG